MQCLNGMIAITRKECQCFTELEGADPELLVSKYGLYLDELNGGISLASIQSSKDCGDGLIDIFKNSIEQAKGFYKADLLAAVATQRKRAYDPFAGYMGSRSFARDYFLQKDIAGIRIEPKQIIGAYMTIKAINFYMAGTATMGFRVLELKKDSAGDEFWRLIHENAVNVSAGQESVYTFENAITLPLYDNDGNDLYYYIVYDRSGSGINPKDNKTRCNCGKSEQQMLQYLEVRGTQADAEANLYQAQIYNEAMGVVPQVELRCGSDEFICDAIANDEAVAMVTAYALLYKAGEIMLDKILNSVNINRWTMTNREQLYGNRKSYRAQYFERITWISQNIDHTGTDCYKCDNEAGIFKAGIRST